MVVVVGRLDTRVREEDVLEERIGTIVWVYTDDVVVLLNDKILWKGPKRDVCLYKDQQ